MKRAMLMLLPLAALYASEAEAGTTGDVRGKIVDDQGNPVAEVTVAITGAGIAGENEVTTNDEGYFKIFGVPPGEQYLKVFAPGFAPLLIDITVR